jgi:hypothetical protein
VDVHRIRLGAMNELAASLPQFCLPSGGSLDMRGF